MVVASEVQHGSYRMRASQKVFEGKPISHSNRVPKPPSYAQFPALFWDYNAELEAGCKQEIPTSSSEG